MRATESLNELATALAKAQGEIQGAHKDSANPFYKSKYADLASVWDACRAPLAKNGIAVVQVPRADGAVVTMETRLIHSSGQWIEGELTSVAKDDGPQSIGSIITYLRRYMLQSFAGIAAEDDDGNAAQGTPEQREPRPQRSNGHKPAKAADVAKEHGMKTAAEIAAENESFDSWGSFILKASPETIPAAIKTFTNAIAKGTITAEHIVKILTRCLDRAETSGQLDMVEKSIRPLCEAAKVPEREFLKFAELLPAAEDRLSQPVA